MSNQMRPSTLTTLGLGSVLDLVRRGQPPVTTSELVDRVFGPSGQRGSLVISGANGIVGAGKTMQLGARIEPFGVPVVALDFPGVPDGLGEKYPGLVRAFGAEEAYVRLIATRGEGSLGVDSQGSPRSASARAWRPRPQARSASGPRPEAWARASP